MKLTRERKIYAGVLGIGLIVLGADRVMGPPSSARASAGGSVVADGGSEGAAASASGIAGTNDQAPSITRVALADRLGEIRTEHGESGAMLDAFRIAPEWRQALLPHEAPEGGEGEQAREAPLPRGVTLPKVTVVVQDQAGGMAVLDGEVLRVGQVSRSGITLVGVERRSVRVLMDGMERTIELAEPAGSGGSMSTRPTK